MTERNSRALPAAVTCAGTVEREAVSRSLLVRGSDAR
jgi:hypothetical protein